MYVEASNLLVENNENVQQNAFAFIKYALLIEFWCLLYIYLIKITCILNT